MGDYFQTIVDLDAAPDEAADLAERAVQWMVSEGIISATRTDCVLGEPLGHPPGPNWHHAVEHDYGKPSDGLAVHVGRTVFDGGQGDPEAVTCPRCDATTALMTRAYELIDEAWRPFRDAISEWEETTGAADVTCPSCEATVPLPEWSWADDYFVFRHLGFKFWNWPELTEEFMDELSEVLDGHDMVYLAGKL